jgi:hypothetical protein
VNAGRWCLGGGSHTEPDAREHPPDRRFGLNRAVAPNGDRGSDESISVEVDPDDDVATIRSQDEERRPEHKQRHGNDAPNER